MSDFRRDNFNDQLTGPTDIAIAGSVLPFPNYTKVGDDKFFYTFEEIVGSGKPVNGQNQSSYDANGANGTFTAGTAYFAGDVITLDDSTTVTVDSASLVIPLNGQSEADYDGAGGNGSFVGGLGYVNGEVITLSDGSTVTDVLVDAGTDVVGFVLDTTTSTGVVLGATLSDTGATGSGAGFSITLGAVNLDGGAVTEFSVDSTSSTGVADGDVLAQTTVTPVGGTGFDLTIGANNLVVAGTINTLKLADGSASIERSTTAPLLVSANAQISVINPADGSAILVDEDQSGLIWLHDQGDNFVVIPDSQQAAPIFVTAEECLLWANAKNPVPEGGNPEPLLVVHEELTAGGTDTITTPINEAPAPGSIGNIDGTYVLNAPSFTPSKQFWLLNTAEKTLADTALIRTYRILDTAPDLDSDSDGLPDSVENNTGTFVDANQTGTDPLNPDSDGDGLSDRVETGDGIFVSTTETGTNPNIPDTDSDGLLDFAETNTGVFIFYNFSDPSDPRNNTGTDPNVLNDTDGDLDPDGTDPDIDGDSTLNEDDAFPFDPSEDTDTDGDGIGNNADPDDDNDGVLDGDDAFPLDPNSSEFNLTLSSSQQASSFEAQSREVIVSTDLAQSWVWDSDSDWLTSSEATTQTGTQVFVYNVTANSTGTARTGTIIFQTISGGISVSLEVTQFGDAAFSLTLSTDSQALSFEPQSNDVTVISNTDWTWESNADWINSAELLNQSGPLPQDFHLHGDRKHYWCSAHRHDYLQDRGR